MDKLKIYQKIRELAEQGQTVYTRADLAYDLQAFGVPNDCFEVGLFVWEAYRYFNQNEKIRTCFYDNERKSLLVDVCQADGLIAENKTDRLFEMELQRLADWNQSLTTVEKTLTEVVREEAVRAGSNLAGTIIGTKGVEQVRKEATTVFNKYAAMVGHYDDAKQQIQLLIADFVKLRAYICDIYRRYSLVLTDAFGDSIKAVAPELFDFDTIEYLDVRAMLQQVQLEYHQISEKCSVLMSEITESFAQSLQSAGIAYRTAGSKQAGLLLAGLNMLSHYMETGQQVTNLKQELLLLKNSVHHDATLIKGDLGRLCVIYKSLNDVAIPEAEAFCKYAGQVLTEEWHRLTDQLYQNEELRKLKEARDVLLDEQKRLERSISDEEMNIAGYSARIEACNQLLTSMQVPYHDARQSKPAKPLFLKNWLTFGAANRSYHRDVYEWNQACRPVITQYEQLQVDVKLDGDELTRLQAALKEHQAEHSRLLREVRQQNEFIMQQIRVDRDIRLQLLPHLEAMINLLRLGRRIANTRLDRSLTKTVTVDRLDVRLPEELSRKIGVFAQAIRENISVSPQMMQDMATSVATISQAKSALDSGMHGPTGEVVASPMPESNLSEQDLVQLTAAGNQTLQAVTGFLEAAARLEAMKVQQTIADQKYRQELAALQNRFRDYMKQIDNRSAALMKALRQLNTAQDHEQLKQGLLALVGDNNDLIRKEDLDELIHGTKTIEL